MKPITVKGPGPSELDDLPVATEEQGKAFREGFAAHVAASPEYREAAKELLRTQNPRPAQKHVERGHVAADAAEVATVVPVAAEPATVSEEPASETASNATEEPPSATGEEHDTVRGVPQMTYASGSSPLADVPAAAEGKAKTLVPAEKAARPWGSVIVIGAALMFIGGLVWMLVSGSSEAGVESKPSASPQARQTTTVEPSQRASAPMPATQLPTNPVLTAPPTTTLPTGPTAATPTTEPRVPSARVSATTDVRDPNGWRFNP